MWADKKYKKRNSGTWLKANPFQGSSHAKGIVLEKMCVPIFSPRCSKTLNCRCAQPCCAQPRCAALRRDGPPRYPAVSAPLRRSCLAAAHPR